MKKETTILENSMPLPLTLGLIKKKVAIVMEFDDTAIEVVF